MKQTISMLLIYTALKLLQLSVKFNQGAFLYFLDKLNAELQKANKEMRQDVAINELLKQAGIDN